MSTREHEAARREPISHTVAGFLAAASIFAGAAALVERPGRLGSAAMFVALIAVAMGGPHRRLANFALVITTVCWFFGMVIAVLLERPII